MIERIQLEANVVRHCTNRCSACSHAAPWAEHYTMHSEVLKRDLDLLAPFLHAQEFHIVGGEPLLHPDLEQIVDAVNASPISTLTVVSTNGKLLPQMGEWFWQKIDVLRLSIYANLDPGIPVKAREQCEKNGVRYDEMGMGKFFKQFHPSLDGASFKDCPWKNQCLTLHDGWLFRCPQYSVTPRSLSSKVGVMATPVADGSVTPAPIPRCRLAWGRGLSYSNRSVY